MSPNVGNFVHDLVEMAKAMETLPQVQAENDRLEHSLNDALRTIQDRELAIIEYKSLIDSLHSRIRSLEVERDDASFRVMEMEDKTHQVMGMLMDFEGKAKGARMILDPPKSEPELQPQAVTTTTDQGSSVADPTTAQAPAENSSTTALCSDASDNTQMAVQDKPVEEAPKSDADPTNTSGSENLAATSTELANRPYFNKRYHDMPNYIPRWDWLNGGGTDADYDWRPSYSQQG